MASRGSGTSAIQPDRETLPDVHYRDLGVEAFGATQRLGNSSQWRPFRRNDGALTFNRASPKSSRQGGELSVYSERDLNAAIAVTRFGLGAKGDEIDPARADPQGWLAAQIRTQGADQPQPDPATSIERINEFRTYRQARTAIRLAGETNDDPVKMAAQMLRRDTGTDFLARAQLGAATDAGFRERWALFWANHFTVSAIKLTTATLIGPFEQEAIRPRVFGRFEDLLVASSSHPAMLLYLDQAQSVGPDTTAAQFLSRGGKQAGLNENLAREILELHTVGVAAGYTQADVTEFARAMTGWSVDSPREPPQMSGQFIFRTAAHEPGARVIMGRRYAEGGQDQALAVMKDLASSPYTARHLATKIARHFVSDDPSPSLVTRLERSFLDGGGQLDAVARTLIASPEAWSPAPHKFKTPYEFMVSSWRATGTIPKDIAGIAPVLNAMGQRPFSAPSPKGWSEDAAVWCDPDAVIKRMAWSESFSADAVGQREPAILAKAALGARLSPRVAQAVARAETRPEGLSFLLMSPEFQRR
jgi:uncharacterized protein (DUF1800 family)